MTDDLLTVLDPDGIVFTSQGSPAFHEACWYNQGQGMVYSAHAFINAAASAVNVMDGVAAPDSIRAGRGSW